ncbi:hypothetical protein F5Y19DRAFT_475793 [Xylariaceae sp. FL1651]|nr:hypothetical protein F5Y19DRAFT_475793 [Xylariaceae sp. FL1651]
MPPPLDVYVRHLTVNAARFSSLVRPFLPPHHILEYRSMDEKKLAIENHIISILNEHLEYLYWPAVLLRDRQSKISNSAVDFKVVLEQESEKIRLGVTLATNIPANWIRRVSTKLGQISTPNTLILYGLISSTSMLIRFVELNLQIRSLAIRYSQVDVVLRHIIQSLLYHESLSSLSLSWDECDIPEASWDRLSHLSQVEVLHLNVGQLCRWPSWFVDHNKVGGYISRWAHLSRLIIQRDTYTLHSDEVDIFDFMRYPDGRKLGTVYWATHESRMLEYASAYVRIRPRLEFIHIGQVLFAVEENNGVRKPVVVGSTWESEGEGNYLALRE